MLAWYAGIRIAHVLRPDAGRCEETFGSVPEPLERVQERTYVGRRHAPPVVHVADGDGGVFGQ